MRRRSFGTPGKEEFGSGADSQQDAKEGHQRGPASEDAAAGEDGGQTLGKGVKAIPEPQEAGREEKSKHNTPQSVLGLGTKKGRTTLPGPTRPPESHEHQDVVPPICNRNPKGP